MAVRNPLAGVTLRAARWSATHPWQAILAWLGMVAVAVGLAMVVPSVGTEDSDYYLGESGRAAQMVDDSGLAGADAEMVLITAASTSDSTPGGTSDDASADNADGTVGGGLDQVQAEAAAAELASRMSGLHGVEAVSPPQWNGDRSALLISIQLALDQEDVTELQQVTADVAAQYDALTIRQAGNNSIGAAIDEQVGADLTSAELTSIPITLLLMLIAFGALIAAGLPVLLGATSVIATMGFAAPLSQLIPAEPTSSSMIVLIGMAVGVDYSLFYLKREREERAKGHSTLDAVAIATETSGHSILVSGFAVITSMAGLFLVGGATFNSLAASAILVVAIAVLGSITVLPALLVKLGRWVDRPRVPLLWRLNRRIGSGGISSRIVGPVVRRPVTALVVSVAAIVALAIPSFSMTLHASSLDTLPAGISEVQTYQAISEKFPGEGAVAEVVVQGSAQAQAALLGVQQDALASGHFVSAGDQPIQVSEDGLTSVLSLAMPYDPASPEIDDALEALRGDILPAVMSGTGATYAVGGGAAAAYDAVEHLGSKLPLVIGFILTLTMLMMGFAFRSPALAVVSTVLNLASVGVAFGLMVLVFQNGWGSDLLGFSTPGYLVDWIPMFVLVVLVGLSMDYHVFVLGRVREYVQAGVPNKHAVMRGVEETAGVVTSAAAVMVSVFSIFATLSMIETKMLGVGLAAAILIDATIIRLVMLPAILVLLGDKAWWPGNRASAGGASALGVSALGASTVGASTDSATVEDRSPAAAGSSHPVAVHGSAQLASAGSTPAAQLDTAARLDAAGAPQQVTRDHPAAGPLGAPNLEAATQLDTTAASAYTAQPVSSSR